MKSLLGIMKFLLMAIVFTMALVNISTDWVDARCNVDKDWVKYVKFTCLTLNQDYKECLVENLTKPNLLWGGKTLIAFLILFMTNLFVMIGVMCSLPVMIVSKLVLNIVGLTLIAVLAVFGYPMGIQEEFGIISYSAAVQVSNLTGYANLDTIGITLTLIETFILAVSIAISYKQVSKGLREIISVELVEIDQERNRRLEVRNDVVTRARAEKEATTIVMDRPPPKYCDVAARPSIAITI